MKKFKGDNENAKSFGFYMAAALFMVSAYTLFMMVLR
jgi:hypothetical protein